MDTNTRNKSNLNLKEKKRSLKQELIISVTLTLLTFIGMVEFTEVEAIQDQDEEEYDSPKVQTNDDADRFKDITDDKLSDICIGNFKEYVENEETAFDTFKDALASGVTKSQLIFSIFYKLFDNNQEIVDKFDIYILELLKSEGKPLIIPH
jgi:hypothetical protein